MIYEFIDKVADVIPGLMMVFARLSALLIAFPFFSYGVITGRIRVMMTLVLTLVLFPLINIEHITVSNPYDLVILISKELFVGLVIGYGARIIFEAFIMAGSFASRQMGLAMANVMDPTSQQQTPIVGQFWFLLMTIVFLLVKGHYLLIEVMFRNFKIIGVGQAIFAPGVGEAVVKSISTSFSLAIKLGLPAMIFLLLADTIIAFSARMMPQMNIFIVTLPMKVLVGFFVMMISIDIFQILYDTVIHEITLYFGSVIHQMAGT